ncbi:MAG TPA: putative peptidoglycan glycosyltransferase FtsW [Anaerolineales bacterium]|nr:putative peptidoglycan glycosyltransferase FtsW [Anaerolineales bacterium]|tara:strand:- start:640 stop:1851 length:1212 start_codon:yes stop_codon:yes gene_type:complete
MSSERRQTENAAGARMTASPAHVDWPLLLATGALLVFGMMMVYSTTFDLSYYWYDNRSTMFVKHMWHMAAGLVALAVCVRLDYQKLRISAVAVGMMLLTLVGLVLVLIFGIDRGLHAGSYQPSELAKLVIIIYLAVWLASKKETLRDFWHGMAPFAVVVGLVAGLIVLQPDISAAATVLVIGGLMFFLAGADMLQLGGALVIAALAGRIVIQFYATGQQRIEEYIAGLRDITEGSWHVLQATVAFVDGGIFGVGLGAGNGKFAYLPVPHTDSVFAVVGEELGLVGSLALVALFVMLSWRGMRIAAHADDTFGQLLAGGLTGWIALEVLINVGVILGVLPFAGNALPLISYGGSSLVVMLAAIGILLSVSRHDPDDRPDREKRANIDLRRWNRRARLSGTGGRR